jgi:hypothetical protein
VEVVVADISIMPSNQHIAVVMAALEEKLLNNGHIK